mgnify:CR=1 FL=1
MVKENFRQDAMAADEGIRISGSAAQGTSAGRYGQIIAVNLQDTVGMIIVVEKFPAVVPQVNAESTGFLFGGQPLGGKNVLFPDGFQNRIRLTGKRGKLKGKLLLGGQVKADAEQGSEQGGSDKSSPQILWSRTVRFAVFSPVRRSSPMSSLSVWEREQFLSLQDSLFSAGSRERSPKDRLPSARMDFRIWMPSFSGSIQSSKIRS